MKNRIFSMVLVTGFLAVWSLFGLTSRAGALTPTLSPTPTRVGCGTVVVVTSTPSPTFTPTPRTATATPTSCGPIYITATPSVGALPDLVITSIFWTPSKPQLGQTITLSAIIMNTGSAASPAGVIHDVRFTILSGVTSSTILSSTTYTQSIAPGSAVTVQADTTWFPTVGTNYTVSGVVDFGQRIVESNESNNSFTASTQVILQPTPFPPTVTPTATACTSLTVTGTVTNAYTMQGIGGATVDADTSVSHPFATTTAADGSYTLSIPAASNYACEVIGMRIWATGYQEQDLAVTSSQLFANPHIYVSLFPNITPSRTPTPGLTPTRTLTPTTGPTVTLTRTPTQNIGACSPVTSTITAPFTFDGAGTFCWKSSNLGSYTNNWNLASLTINGVNFTGQYVASSSYPAQIGGFWYVNYVGNFAWSHFEAK